MRNDQRGHPLRTSLLVAGVYLGTLLATIAVGFAATGLAIGLANSLPRKTLPDWAGWPLNVLPSMICATGAFSLVALALVRRRLFLLGAIGHMARSFSLYVVMFGALGMLFAARNNSDLGLFMQLLIWPAATALGGILTDLITVAMLRKLRAHAL